MITSRQNDRVKLLRSLLTQPKARRDQGLIALEGSRLIKDAIIAGFQPEFILFDPSRPLSLEPGSTESDYWVEVSPEVMESATDCETSPGIAGVFRQPELELPFPLRSAILLDGLRDPGNLGAMLRTAAAAGVDAAFLAPGCVDPWNPKALRGGMGAQFRLPLRQESWDGITTRLSGLRTFLADSRGGTCYREANWLGPWALIIGSEAHGPSEEARNLSQQVIHIPLANDTESLNAVVAAGIILFEAMKPQES